MSDTLRFRPGFRASPVRLPLAALLVALLGSSASAQSFGLPANVNMGVGIAPDQITGASAGDLDGDGNGDLVAVDNAVNGNVGAALGLGSGTYSAPVVSGPTGVAAASNPQLGDFDLDGTLDIAFGGRTGAGLPALVAVRGDPATPGSFLFPGTLVVAGAAGDVTALRITDFDRDGNQDILASLSGGGVRSVVVLPGLPGMAFSPLVSSTTAVGPEDIDICIDFNKDAFKDLAACGQDAGLNGRVVIYPGIAAPPFIGPPLQLSLPPGTRPLAVHWFDCNQDQFYDLAVTVEGTVNGIIPVLNLGAPPFFDPSSALPPVLISNKQASLLRLDADFDGFEDLTAVAIGSGPTVVPLQFEVLKVVDCALSPALVTNAGSFQQTAVGDTVAQLHAVQDQNFDGRIDVIVVDQGPAVDQLRVFPNIQPVSLTITPARPLLGETTNIVFRIQVPPVFSGRPYFILFSTRGTTPPVPIGGSQFLPLELPLLPLMLNSTIGPGGQAQFTVGPVTFAPAPQVFSLQLYAAAVVLNPSTGAPLFVTNPAIITIP